MTEGERNPFEKSELVAVDRVQWDSKHRPIVQSLLSLIAKLRKSNKQPGNQVAEDPTTTRPEINPEINQFRKAAREELSKNIDLFIEYDSKGQFELADNLKFSMITAIYLYAKSFEREPSFNFVTRVGYSIDYFLIHEGMNPFKGYEIESPIALVDLAVDRRGGDFVIENSDVETVRHIIQGPIA